MSRLEDLQNEVVTGAGFEGTVPAPAAPQTAPQYLLSFTPLLDIEGDWRGVAHAAVDGKLEREAAPFLMLCGAVRKLDERLRTVELAIASLYSKRG